MNRTVQRFNKMWERKEIDKPLVILYGGYAGTGKSTTCKTISELIKYTTSLPTGVIRSSIANYLTTEDIKLISSHTYKLHEVGDYLDPHDHRNREEIEKRFLKQIEPISRAINGIVDFAASEKQHIIIDGNHVFPGLVKPNSDVHMFEFYNMVTDKDKHLDMLCGPTHNRSLSEEEFTTARILHDFTVRECRKHNKEIFEYSESQKIAIEKINSRFSDICNT